jgi:GNAT superfamily N-acetyltransferase
MVTTKKVESKKDLKKFIKFNLDLYKGNAYCATPLIFDELKTLSSESNPAFDFCESAYWLAYKNNEIVGRIGAIINQKEIDPDLGRIGFVDFIDDEEVVSALFKTAINWLKKKGKLKVHGPLGFTDLDRQGLLIEGFDKEGTMATIYNYPYYQKHIEALGFEKSTDWVEYRLDIQKPFPAKLERLTEFIRNHYSVSCVPLKSKKQLQPYIESVFKLINDSYSNLYGFTQLSEKQIEFYAKNYLGFVNVNLISLVQDKDGELIGVGICLPSFTKALQKAKGSLFPLGWFHMLRALQVNDTLDLYLIAIDQKWQNKGINALMLESVYKNAQKFGIKYVETNIELEDNKKVQSMWKYFDKEQHKRRRCYVKTL